MGRFEKIACTASDPAIALQGLSKLEHLLLRRMPQSVHMLILCRIALKQRYPKCTLIEFYRYVEGNDTPNWHNDLENDSFIICFQKPNTFSKKGVVFLPPENPITEDMITTLDEFVGWDTPQAFSSVPVSLAEVIQDLCIKHKNARKDGSECVSSTFNVMLDIEKAKRMETFYDDETISLKDIDLKYVPEIVDSWGEWAEDHSTKVIGESLKTLGGVGAFTDKGELASCITLSPIGEMGILYTPERFRRRGLAELVLRAMSKKVANELGITPYGEVVIGNVASQRLFQKLQFQGLYRTKLFRFIPPGPTLAEAS